MKNLLEIQQLDSFFGKLRGVIKKTPPKGWIHTIRSALGMRGEQLAHRLGVGQSRVVRIEQDEITGAITLRTLKQAADALECELVYVLVPKESLQATLVHQADKIADKRLQRVAKTMSLEAQMPEQKDLDIMKKTLVEELLANNKKHLWED